MPDTQIDDSKALNSTPSLNTPVPNITPAIKSEEEFHDKIEEAKEKSRTHTDTERYRPLAEALHEKLRLQDSEAALTLVTK